MYLNNSSIIDSIELSLNSKIKSLYLLIVSAKTSVLVVIIEPSQSSKIVSNSFFALLYSSFNFFSSTVSSSDKGSVVDNVFITKIAVALFLISAISFTSSKLVLGVSQAISTSSFGTASAVS